MTRRSPQAFAFCLLAVMSCCSWIGLLKAQVGGAQATLERQARREFDSGDYEAAARDFTELTTRNPADIFSHIMLGTALFRQQKYVDSIPPYEKALALEKNGQDVS